MFIQIKEYIINIEEIKVIEKIDVGYGKFTIKIRFRDETDNISFSEKGEENANATMNYLFAACKNYKK